MQLAGQRTESASSVWRCLAVQKRGDDAVEVPEWAEKLAEAIAALEKLRVLLSLVGKPESICLTATEVQELQKQLRDYAEWLKG
jgi:hypothetical protein